MSTEPRDTIARTICDERWGIDGQAHDVTGWDRSTADAVLAALQTGGWELTRVATNSPHGPSALPPGPEPCDHVRRSCQEIACPGQVPTNGSVMGDADWRSEQRAAAAAEREAK